MAKSTRLSCNIHDSRSDPNLFPRTHFSRDLRTLRPIGDVCPLDGSLLMGDSSFCGSFRIPIRRHRTRNGVILVRASVCHAHTLSTTTAALWMANGPAAHWRGWSVAESSSSAAPCWAWSFDLVTILSWTEIRIDERPRIFARRDGST